MQANHAWALNRQSLNAAKCCKEAEHESVKVTLMDMAFVM
jgi:hypothetical protein